MQGALCHCGKASAMESLGFCSLTLQEWRSDSHSTRVVANLVSQRREGGAGGVAMGPVTKLRAEPYRSATVCRVSERVGFKDIDRGGESNDECLEDRSLQMSGDDETGRRGSVELAAHVDAITSVQNPYVKHVVRLRTNTSYRSAAGCVVVVGAVPLREICQILAGEEPGAGKPIKVLLVFEGTRPLPDLSLWAERIVYVSEPVLRKVAGVDSALGLHGVGVLALPPSFCSLEGGGDMPMNWLSYPRRVLVLDGIQDPGNLGTLLRTAAAFAWDGVFLLPGGCDPFNEKALRASRGASFMLPIATGRWSQLQSFADMHKMKLYAADPDRTDIRPLPKKECIQPVIGTGTETTDTLSVETVSKDAVSNVNNSIAIAAAREALCLILGSEGQGLSENAHQSCERVSIPMPGDFESLNVAVAGGILLYLLNNKTAVTNVAS